MLDGILTNAYFGHTVAGAGDLNGDGYADLAVGAFRMGPGSLGQVAVFWGARQGLDAHRFQIISCPTNQWSRNDPAGPVTERFLEFSPDGPDFGHQVEGVGDVNGDGLDDLIVGSTHYAVEDFQGGAAFVYHGSRGGKFDAPSWKFLGEKHRASLGFSVAAAGDVNGDGYADVLVGSPGYGRTGSSGAATAHGRALLFLGGAKGLSATPAWSAVGELPQSQFGYSLHGAGDVNGDGFDDVIVGDFNFYGSEELIGKAYVYLGGSNGLDALPSWTVSGVQKQASLGGSVFTAGDVNHDGYSDIILSANGVSHGHRHEGMVMVFLGSPSGLSSKPDWTFESNQEEAYLGHSVATAGDLNGDGFSDVVMSSFFGGQSTPSEGLALVFHGGRTGLETTPRWTGRGGQFQSGYGATVRSAGDVNGDGYDDLVVGQPHFKKDGLEYGRTWIAYGGPDGLQGSSGWRQPRELLNISIPYPTGWNAALAGAAGLVVMFGLTRTYYLRREQMMGRLQAARDAAQREERNRIAQDLHDQLGAHLTEIALASGNAAQAADASTVAGRCLRHVENVAGKLVEDLAKIVWLTKSENDTAEALIHFLVNEVSALTAAAEVSCQLDVPERIEPTPISADLRHDLLLAVKESVHNALKHANASRIVFEASLENGLLRFEVRDNGRGFDVTGAARSGNGLRHLQERLIRHGGRAVVESEPGAGTTVRFEASVLS